MKLRLIGWLWIGLVCVVQWGTAGVAMAQDEPPDDDMGDALPLFSDVSQTAGIMNNRIGTEKEIGIAWGDVNNDGAVDLYVTDHAGPNTLYQNNGDGTFSISLLSDQVALPAQHSTGASLIDYDNDGWQDLLVLNWGENVLYRNVEGGGFADVTAVAGVGGGDKNSKTASWGDFNRDGHLDLYIANWACYPKCGRPSAGDSDRFYQNNGDGTFTQITHLLSGKTTGAGFVASFTDYDNDGDLDIYLVNDEFIHPVGNGLWRNDGLGCGGWCFTEVSAAAGADTQLMGMGLATADYDNDGDQDFYFSNAGPMALLQNQGDGTFSDQAAVAGVQTADTISWGTVFFDYNNDGWQDLYVAISDVASEDGTQNNDLFRNNRDGTFSDLSAASGVDDAGATLGVATADYDRDGRLDLLVGNIDSGYVLYRNNGVDGADNHWLTLDLVGGGPVNRAGVGTRVWVTTAAGGTQMQELIAGSSLGSGNELLLHFGLGEAAVVDTLRVRWPDGVEQVFEDVPADQRVTLRYVVEDDGIDIESALVYPATENAPPAPQQYALQLFAALFILLLGLGVLFVLR